MMNWHLVADVGGTHARLALVKAGQTELHHVTVYLCAQFEGLAHAIKAFLRTHGIETIEAASVAVACPVNQDWVRFTNNPWSFSRQQLQAELSLKSLRVLNDFSAMALGMLACDSAEFVSVCDGQAQAQSPVLVIGPGTGLGFSALIPNAQGWTALATEGGHVGYAPRDELDLQILQLLMSRHNNRVSAERVLCGQGLVNLYQCLCQIHGVEPNLTSAAQVSEAAQSGTDAQAQGALDRFCFALGAYCGDMVLALGARGGVRLCGGILPRIQDVLLHSEFEQGFRNKGRFTDYMQHIPVQLCLASQPGLLGAAVALQGQHVCFE